MRIGIKTSRRQFLAFGAASATALALRVEDQEALRRKLAADRNRPQYHIVPPAHFLNDPNGPLYWKGKYHMFYQYAPGGGMFSTKFWYHAVSEDMAHWRNLGVALAPSPGGPDKDGCWSGSAVIHNGVPTLVYTGAFFKGENERAERANGLIPERQMVAVAADPNDPDLLKWNKIAENPVIAAPPEGMTVAGWRDPALWKEGDAWRMVIGSGVRDVGGMALLYRSKDLRRWEYLHPLATAKANPNQPGGGVLLGPSFSQWDMSFFKSFAITERFKAQFRAESYNFANHMNLANPNTCVDCPGSAGRITSLYRQATPRQWQFGLRLEY